MRDHRWRTEGGQPQHQPQRIQFVTVVTPILILHYDRHPRFQACYCNTHIFETTLEQLCLQLLNDRLQRRLRQEHGAASAVTFVSTGLTLRLKLCLTKDRAEVYTPGDMLTLLPEHIHCGAREAV